MRTTLLIHAVLMYHCCAAQEVIDPGTARCAEGSSEVHVTPLHSDSLASSFLLCVDTEVKAHFHRAHTEHVFVLEGTATMRLGDEERTIKAGDTVIIPVGTVHAVRVTGDAPLRVISVQAPRFDGSDRVMVK
jgi:mannose-6-phosphate isomerase-like protein (cupin superfamily)